MPQHRAKRRGQRGRILGGDQEPRLAVSEHLRDAADRRRHDGDADRHRLEQGLRHALRPDGREDEAVHEPEQFRHIATEAGEADGGREAAPPGELLDPRPPDPVADQHEPGLGELGPEPLERVEEMRVPLRAPEHRDRADHRTGGTELAQQRLASLPRREPGQVDPRGDRADGLGADAPGEYERADRLAARQDAIGEPGVDRVETGADRDRHVPGAHHGHPREPRRRAAHPRVDRAVGVDEVDLLPPDDPREPEDSGHVPRPPHSDLRRLQGDPPGLLPDPAPRLGGEHDAHAALA